MPCPVATEALGGQVTGGLHVQQTPPRVLKEGSGSRFLVGNLEWNNNYLMLGRRFESGQTWLLSCCRRS